MPSFPKFAKNPKFNFPFRRSFYGSVPAVHDIDMAIEWFLCFWQELLALQEAGSRCLQREDKAMLWQRGLGGGSAGHSGAAPAGKEMSDRLLLLLAGVLGMESLGAGSGMVLLLLLPSSLLPSGAWAAWRSHWPSMGSSGTPLQTQPKPIIVPFAVPGEGVLNETNAPLSTSAWFDMADQRKGWVLPIKSICYMRQQHWPGHVDQI